MQDCVFCKIVAGEIPCYKVFENRNFLAFLDIKPQGAGHTLLIPKKHFRWVWDLPAGRQVSPNYNEYFETVRDIYEVLRNKLSPDWIELRILGMDIPHTHIHLIPHWNKKPPYNPADFEQIAKLLV